MQPTINPIVSEVIDVTEDASALRVDLNPLTAVYGDVGKAALESIGGFTTTMGLPGVHITTTRVGHSEFEVTPNLNSMVVFDAYKAGQLTRTQMKSLLSGARMSVVLQTPHVIESEAKQQRYPAIGESITTTGDKSVELANLYKQIEKYLQEQQLTQLPKKPVIATTYALLMAIDNMYNKFSERYHQLTSGKYSPLIITYTMDDPYWFISVDLQRRGTIMVTLKHTNEQAALNTYVCISRSTGNLSEPPQMSLLNKKTQTSIYTGSNGDIRTSQTTPKQRHKKHPDT